MSAIYVSSKTGGLKQQQKNLQRISLASMPEIELFGNSVCEGLTYTLEIDSKRIQLLNNSMVFILEGDGK